MKTLKSLFVVGLFIIGLSFTACSSDDKYVTPEPENPVAEVPGHPIGQPPVVNPL